jgi:hypothetical protein
LRRGESEKLPADPEKGHANNCRLPPRAVDRPIDVGFRRQVHHDIGAKLVQRGPHCRSVGDIGLDEPIQAAAVDIGER